VGRIQDRFIRLNGLQFHYRDWGNEGAPVLLLLHGGWQAATDWDAVAEVLTNRYHVLALDQRGHGGSDRATDYALERFADDLEAFVSHLGLRRFALLGFSWGGTVAYFYAARQPESLSALVIVDIGPDWAEVIRPRVRPGQLVIPPRPTDPAYRMPELFDLYPPEATHWPLLAHITCPTWLIRAAQSNRLSRSTAERMVTTIPSCRLVEIPDSGHLVLRDNRAAFLTAVQTIL
jgi:esterase